MQGEKEQGEMKRQRKRDGVRKLIIREADSSFESWYATHYLKGGQTEDGRNHLFKKELDSHASMKEEILTRKRFQL